MVVATAYLAGKIDSVQRSVNAVSDTLNSQDQREHLRITASYAGALNAARELVASNATVSAVSLASRLVEARHGSLAYIEGLRRLLDSSPPSAELMDHSLDLMIRLLDLIPAAMLVERDLGLMIGDAGLFENADQGPLTEYRRHFAEFKRWCEDKYRGLVLGEGGSPEILRKHRPALQHLFKSPMNEFMLTSLSRRSSNTASEPSPFELLVAAEPQFKGTHS